MNEGHCVRDAVEGQSSCTVIHIHSYSRGAGDYRECSPFVIVPEWASGFRAEQTPWLIITSKSTLISLPADALIWHWYTHPTTPLHLPVTASTHSLSTQHLRKTIKSVWMIRIYGCSSQVYLITLFSSDGNRFLFAVFGSKVSWWESDKDKTHNMHLSSNKWLSIIKTQHNLLFYWGFYICMESTSYVRHIREIKLHNICLTVINISSYSWLKMYN